MIYELDCRTVFSRHVSIWHIGREHFGLVRRLRDRHRVFVWHLLGRGEVHGVASALGDTHWTAVGIRVAIAIAGWVGVVALTSARQGGSSASNGENSSDNLHLVCLMGGFRDSLVCRLMSESGCVVRKSLNMLVQGVLHIYHIDPDERLIDDASLAPVVDSRDMARFRMPPSNFLAALSGDSAAWRGVDWPCIAMSHGFHCPYASSKLL